MNQKNKDLTEFILQLESDNWVRYGSKLSDINKARIEDMDQESIDEYGVDVLLNDDMDLAIDLSEINLDLLKSIEKLLKDGAKPDWARIMRYYPTTPEFTKLLKKYNALPKGETLKNIISMTNGYALDNLLENVTINQDILDILTDKLLNNEVNLIDSKILLKHGVDFNKKIHAEEGYGFMTVGVIKGDYGRGGSVHGWPTVGFNTLLSAFMLEDADHVSFLHDKLELCKMYQKELFHLANIMGLDPKESMTRKELCKMINEAIFGDNIGNPTDFNQLQIVYKQGKITKKQLIKALNDLVEEEKGTYKNTSISKIVEKKIKEAHKILKAVQDTIQDAYNEAELYGYDVDLDDIETSDTAVIYYDVTNNNFNVSSDEIEEIIDDEGKIVLYTVKELL